MTALSLISWFNKFAGASALQNDVERFRTGKSAQQSNILGKEIVPKFTDKAAEKDFANLTELDGLAQNKDNPAYIRYSDRKYDKPGAKSAIDGSNIIAYQNAQNKIGIKKAEEKGLSAWDLGQDMNLPPQSDREAIINARQVHDNATNYSALAKEDNADLSKRTANIYRSKPISTHGTDGEPLLNINPKRDFVKAYPLEEMRRLESNNEAKGLLALRNIADYGARAKDDQNKLLAAEHMRNLLQGKEEYLYRYGALPKEAKALDSYLDVPTMAHLEASIKAGELAPAANRNIAHLQKEADRLRKLYPGNPAAVNIEAEIKRLRNL